MFSIFFLLMVMQISLTLQCLDTGNMSKNICPMTILYKAFLNIIGGKGSISNINYYYYCYYYYHFYYHFYYHYYHHYH